MPQVPNQYKAGRKPFDTNVQLQREGEDLYVLLPKRKNSRNYLAGALGLLGIAGFSFLKVIEYEGDFFFLSLAMVLTGGAFLVWGIGAFMQVGLYSNGRRIRLLKKLFNYPIQAVENVVKDFESVELLTKYPERDDPEIEIVISFTSGDPLRFGAELSDEEQNWLVNELIDYLQAARAQRAVRQVPA